MTSHAGLTRRWVRATWGGWLLGIPCIISLALAGEAAGIGGSQVLVGAGMGAGVGLMQGRVMRDVIGEAAPWAWYTATGLALPFLGFDFARAAGRDWPFSLYLCTAIGGLIVGAWQARLLRPRFRGTASWVAASAVGWSLSAGAAALADSGRVSHSVRGIAGALLFLGIVAFGGLALGLVTGAALARLPCQQTAA